MSDTMGDFITTMGDKMFSFGVSESTDPNTNKVTGHTLSLCLHSKDGATERDIKRTDKLELLLEKCKDYIMSPSVKKQLKRTDLERAELKTMNKFIYWKKDEDGNRVADAGPTISPKLVEFNERKDDKGNIRPYNMVTTFYLPEEVDDEGNPRVVSPLDFMSNPKEKKFKFCYVYPAIKFDNIYISGAKFALQAKVLEADVETVESGPRKLLHGRHSVKEVKKTIINTSASSGHNPLLSQSKDEDEEEGNEKESKKAPPPSDELKDEDEPKEEAPKKVKKIVKKKTTDE